MGTGCTSRYHIDVLSLQTIGNADITGCHIRDHQRDPQRAYLGRAFFQKTHIVSFNGLQAADTAAHGTAHTKSILFFHIQTGIFDRFSGCRHRKLGKALHTLCRLFINGLERVIILYFRRDLYFVVRGIKSRDRSKAGFSLFDPCPKTLHILTDGGDCPQSGDHYASVFHIAIPPSTHSTCPVI